MCGFPAQADASTLSVSSMTREQVTIYRRMSAAERLRVAFGLHAFARKRLEAALRREHPDCSDRELAHEVMRRFLG